MSDVTARLHDLLAPWCAPVAFDPQLGNDTQAMELLIERLSKSKSNKEFLESMSAGG